MTVTTSSPGGSTSRRRVPLPSWRISRARAAGSPTSSTRPGGLSPLQGSVEAVLAVDLLGVALTLDEFGKVIESGGAGVIISSMAAHFYPPMDPGVELQLATAPTDELLNLEACLGSHRQQPAGVPIRQACQSTSRGRLLLVHGGDVAPESTPSARASSPPQWTAGTGPGFGSDDAGHGRELRDGCIGTPDDIAAAADFLLSPSASFITGIDLLVDGGVVAAVRTGSLALTGANSSP